MKNTLYLILFVISAIFTSCQNELITEKEDTAPLSRTAISGTFTFYNSYIYWNDDSYMLDYSLLGNYDNLPLDADIVIPYIVTTQTGRTSTFNFTIPAGSTNVSIEGTTLGEAIVGNMGLNRYDHYITSITILPYSYSGNMTIVGLDSIDRSPEEVYPQPPVVTPTSPISAEWTRGSYNIGGELKVLTYFDAEGGMDRSYTLVSRGALIMEVKLTNMANNALTCLARDFAIQRYEGNTTPYSKQTSIYLTNSPSVQSVSSISIPAGSTKTVYFYTTELFYEGNGFDYDTTPPYHIQLAYKNKAICGDDIFVEHNSYIEGWN